MVNLIEDKLASLHSPSTRVTVTVCLPGFSAFIDSGAISGMITIGSFGEYSPDFFYFLDCFFITNKVFIFRIVMNIIGISLCIRLLPWIPVIRINSQSFALCDYSPVNNNYLLFFTAIMRKKNSIWRIAA